MGFLWKVGSYTADKWISLFPCLLGSFNNVCKQQVNVFFGHAVKKVHFSITFRSPSESPQFPLSFPVLSTRPLCLFSHCMLQLGYVTLLVLSLLSEAFYLHGFLPNIVTHPLLILLYIFQTFPSIFFSSISDTSRQITFRWFNYTR